MQNNNRTLTVYKASAGSGKTYTLAYEYIKLLLGKRRADGSYILNKPGTGALNRPHARILAITFTNKATAEMKGRILKELDALTRIPDPNDSSAKDAAYASRLMKEFGCSRSELQVAASKALRGLLNDYGAFNVSTIDAFFQTILRSFAREIDRQGDYRLEIDETSALAQSLSMLFDEVNLNPADSENKEILRWLSEQALERMKEGGDYNPFNRKGSLYGRILKQLSGIFNEEFLSREKEMTEYLSDPKRLSDFSDWLRNETTRLAAEEVRMSAELKEHIEPLNRNYKDLLKFLDKIIGEGCLSSDLTSAKSIYMDLVRSGELGEDALSWYNDICASHQLRGIYDEVLRRLHNLRAINSIYRFIDRYRVENNLLLISDSNSLLKTIIDGSDTPFIYERVGMTLENFLIDEFQDTSRMQWDNLRPLIHNSLGTADSLIIGDEKQSIYRFRGGDPQLLATEVTDINFPNHSEVKGANPGENTNYRSAHDIVRFNNTLFYNLSKIPGGHVPGYAGVAQSLSNIDNGSDKLNACIRINNLSSDMFEKTAAKLLSPAVIERMKNEGTFVGEGVALRILGETIIGQLDRGYRQSEIAILCRKGTDGTDIAEFLSREYPRIKLVSEESLLLRNSNAIKLIISFLEIIDRGFEATDVQQGVVARGSATGANTDSNDDREHHRLYTGYMLRRRRAALSDSFEYYLAKGEDINEALDKALKAAENMTTREENPDSDTNDIVADINYIRRLAPTNLSALVQAIVDRKLTPAERKAEMPYITAFVDLVDEFLQNSIGTLNSFMEYWNDNSGTIAIAPGLREEAVTISTVHKAKGLEWPCVHIPLMDWALDAEPRTGWYETSHIACGPDIVPPPIIYLKTNNNFGKVCSPFKSQFDKLATEERTDNLNVAYVAFTRASRELHVNLLSKVRSSPIGDSIIALFHNPPALPDSSGIYLDVASYVTDTDSFWLGEPTVPVRDSKGGTERVNVLEAPNFEVSFNRLNERLTSHVDMTTTAWQQADADLGNEEARDIVDTPVNPQMEQAAREGINMHSILSQMITVEDLDTALDSHRRTIQPSDLELYRKVLEAGFAQGGDIVAGWFAPDNPKVLCEQSIFCRSTGRITRADRIVWRPDGSVEVIDFKFTGAVNESHYEQVRAYGLSLMKMGYEPVRAYLWYPLLNKILEVKDL